MAYVKVHLEKLRKMKATKIKENVRVLKRRQENKGRENKEIKEKVRVLKRRQENKGWVNKENDELK